MTRREALVAGAALFGASVAGPCARPAEHAHVDPFHDPEYSVIHSRETLLRYLSPQALSAQIQPRVVNGITVTGLPNSIPALDEGVTAVMNASGIPGVTMCLAHNKRLFCTRGYGKVSLSGGPPIEPTMPGGLMSVTKPLTTHSALMLVRDQKLHLHDRAFKILDQPPLLAPGESADPRMNAIQVRHLMNHTSGLFNFVEGHNDPPRFEQMARSGQIRLVHGRINQYDLVRLGMREPLLFDPGSKGSYSGQGMQVLGRIVEKLGALRLDKFIFEHIFGPLGIRSFFMGSYLADGPFQQLLKSDRSRLYALCPHYYDANARTHTPRNETNSDYTSWGQADSCGWAVMSCVDLLRWITFLPELIGPQVMAMLTMRSMITNDQGQKEHAAVHSPRAAIIHPHRSRGLAPWRGNGSPIPRLIRPTNAVTGYERKDHPARSSACTRIKLKGSASYGLRASATAAFVFSPRRSLARMVPSGPIRNVAGMAMAP
jgi:CubicO group peptidase (beta-lactamase class C family)